MEPHQLKAFYQTCTFSRELFGVFLVLAGLGIDQILVNSQLVNYCIAGNLPRLSQDTK